MSFDASIEYDVINPWRAVPERDIFDGIFDEYLHQSLRKMSTGEEVLDEFFDCIRELDCKKLLSMIEKLPQLAVEIGTQGRTALHTAVIASCEELVGKVLHIVFDDGNKDPRALQLVNRYDKELQLKNGLGKSKTLRKLIESSRLSGNEFSLHIILGYPCKMSERLKFLKKVCCVLEPASSGLLSTLLHEVRDKQGRMPLHVLVEEPWYQLGDCISMLRSCCPDFNINVSDFVGRTPLHWAAAQGLQGSVNYLAKVEGIDLNAQFDLRDDRRYGNNEQFTALNLAVMHDHNEVVKTLLLQPLKCEINSICIREIEVNGRHDWCFGQWTPFQIAAMKGHVPILQTLMKVRISQFVGSRLFDVLHRPSR